MNRYIHNNQSIWHTFARHKPPLGAIPLNVFDFNHSLIPTPSINCRTYEDTLRTFTLNYEWQAHKQFNTGVSTDDTEYISFFKIHIHLFESSFHCTKIPWILIHRLCQHKDRLSRTSSTLRNSTQKLLRHLFATARSSFNPKINWMEKLSQHSKQLYSKISRAFAEWIFCAWAFSWEPNSSSPSKYYHDCSWNEERKENVNHSCKLLLKVNQNMILIVETKVEK